MAEDQLALRLSRIKWRYADADLAGAYALEHCLADAARAPQLVISYSELVDGVDLWPGDLNVTLPYRINVPHWTPLDRGIIGDYLGYISMHTYRHAGFLAGALVVDKNEQKPSEIFFDWMRELGALLEDDNTVFWITHLNRARDWYASHPGEVIMPNPRGLI